jgi:hypothetical protein
MNSYTIFVFCIELCGFEFTFTKLSKKPCQEYVFIMTNPDALMVKIIQVIMYTPIGYLFIFLMKQK